jgi:predicted transcriptional regulator
MDTSTIIGAELLAEAKSVLQEGETLAAFVEQSIRSGILRRRLRLDFIERGLAAGEEAERTGEYIDADDVLRELDGMLMSKGRAGER